MQYDKQFNLMIRIIKKGQINSPDKLQFKLFKGMKYIHDNYFRRKRKQQTHTNNIFL